MEKLKKNKTTILILSLFASVALPLGVPMIVFGAVYKLWILMAFGILFVLFGFYGCPLLWVGYGKKRYLYSLALKIEVDGVYSIANLANIYNKNHIAMLEDVKLLISKRYLINYIIDEDLKNVTPYEKEKKLVTFFCPSCGASIVRNSSNKYVCEYCHTSFEYK